MGPLRRPLRIALGVLAYVVLGFTVVVSTLHRDEDDTLRHHAAMAQYAADLEMNGLRFATAEKKYRLAADLVRAYAGWRDAEQDASLAEAFEGWADALKAQGRYAEAVKRYARAIAIYEKADGLLANSLIDPLWSLKQIHREMGRDSLADLCSARVDSIASFRVRIVEKEVERLRAGRARGGGGDGRALADRLMSLGGLYAAQRALGRAEVAYLEAYEIRRRAFGPAYYETVSAQQHRGMAAALMGKNTDAISALDSALTWHEGSFGKDSHYVAEEMSALGALALDRSRFEEAESLYRRALEAIESQVGPDHNYALSTMARLAECRAMLGRFAEAKAMWARIYGTHRRLHGAFSYPAGIDLLEIAEIEERSGDAGTARVTCSKALHVLEKAVGPRHPSTVEARYYLSELVRSVREAEDGAEEGAPAGSERAGERAPAEEDTPTNDPENLSAA